MVNNQFKEMLLIMYQEINEHHREQTKQNNQIITFYIAFISFFVGINSSLNSSYNAFIVHCVYLMVILVGYLSVLMLVQLRVWQLRYAGGLQFIASIVFSDTTVNNLKDFNRCVAHFVSKSPTKHSIFAPLTCKMIWGCMAISFLPIGLYYNYLIMQYTDIVDVITFFAILFLLLYLFALANFFKKKIEGTGNMGDILWLFDIYDFSALDKGDK